MTDAPTPSPKRSWIDKELRSDVPPAKRALAVALQELCRHIKPGKSTRNRVTQATAAKHLDCSESSLSRFLSGQAFPALELVEGFYRKAWADAGCEPLDGVTLDDLRRLHALAEAERRRGSVSSDAEVEQLTRQLQEAKAECTTLKEEVIRLRQEVTELITLRQDLASQKAAIAQLKAARAGLQARLVARASSAPLPVPRRRGDRQRMQNDVSAARQLALQASDLNRSAGPNVALTHLRQNAEVLSPQEMATLLLLLRKHQDDRLADDVIHIYGRDQSTQDVLQTTLALHEQGATDDAGALMRAALR